MILARIILGFLALSPMTGYDLKRHFDSTVGHFWSADKAQIYRTLAQLVADGLAEVETVVGSAGPDRQEHRITEAGRAALATWLESKPDRQVDRDPFLARVFFSADLDAESFRSLLAQRRVSVQEQLARLEPMRTGQTGADRGSRLRLATLDNGVVHLRTELAWLDAVEEEFA